MLVKDVTQILEELAPLHYAEDFDNVGLLVGNRNTEVTGILVTLDTLENVVDEAIAKKCNLIVSFHPIIFSGLKRLTGNNYVERVVLKAIENQIAIYSMHTALDNSKLGVNAKICEVLGLTSPKILIPKKGTLKKLVTYVPVQNAAHLKHALCDAGGGAVGNYTDCSFFSEGTGSFKGNAASNPVVGAKGELQSVKEMQLHITFEAHLEKTLMNALFENHPYEEVSYEIYTLDNTNQNIGMGMLAELENAMEETTFLKLLKEKLNVTVVRHSGLLGKKIKKVAVLGGSGAFAIGAAKSKGADVFVTADIKYHQFYEAEKCLVIADVGHFETEQFTKNLLVDYLTKKIPNFAILFSESITNPIKYF